MHKVRNDIILIFVILLIAGLSVLFMFIFSEKDNITAIVYYNETKVLEIDLKEDGEYFVEGENGKVKIQVQDSSIFVVESNCKDHICMNQGKISRENQTITCLPNKVYIRIEKAKKGVDVVV